MLKGSGNADSVSSHLPKKVHLLQIVDSRLHLQLSSNWREYLAQGALPAKGEFARLGDKM